MAHTFAFNPQREDPRIAAERHWTDMISELQVTRQQLEKADSIAIANAELIDMLRKELADEKAEHRKDRDALIVVRTKLQAAGHLILDALKDDETPIKDEIARDESEKPAGEINQKDATQHQTEKKLSPEPPIIRLGPNPSQPMILPDRPASMGDLNLPNYGPDGMTIYPVGWRPEVAPKPLQDFTRMAPIQTIVEPPDDEVEDDEIAAALRSTQLPKTGWP